MQFETGVAQTLFSKNSNLVMVEDEVSNVNFKGFMMDSANVN
jgi:hypothetical protein